MVSAAAEWDEVQARLNLARAALHDLFEQITTTGTVYRNGGKFKYLANMRTTVTVAAGLLDEVAVIAAAGGERDEARDLAGRNTAKWSEESARARKAEAERDELQANLDAAGEQVEGGD